MTTRKVVWPAIQGFPGAGEVLGLPPLQHQGLLHSSDQSNLVIEASYTTTDGAVSLLYALGRTAIRHTQQQHLGGETVCKLPEKTEETIAEFSEEEQLLYVRVHKDAKADFHDYTAQGSNWVSCNLLAIVSLLSPLRAICSGGSCSNFSAFIYLLIVVSGACRGSQILPSARLPEDSFFSPPVPGSQDKDKDALVRDTALPEAPVRLAAAAAAAAPDTQAPAMQLARLAAATIET